VSDFSPYPLDHTGVCTGSPLACKSPQIELTCILTRALFLARKTIESGRFGDGRVWLLSGGRVTRLWLVWLRVRGRDRDRAEGRVAVQGRVDRQVLGDVLAALVLWPVRRPPESRACQGSRRPPRRPAGRRRHAEAHEPGQDRPRRGGKNPCCPDGQPCFCALLIPKALAMWGLRRQRRKVLTISWKCGRHSSVSGTFKPLVR
jgi:hypothetical protein